MIAIIIIIAIIVVGFGSIGFGAWLPFMISKRIRSNDRSCSLIERLLSFLLLCGLACFSSTGCGIVGLFILKITLFDILEPQYTNPPCLPVRESQNIPISQPKPVTGEKLGNIQIGIIQVGEYQAIYERLVQLGATATIIPETSNITIFRKYDMIFIPSTWAQENQPMEQYAEDYQLYVYEGGGLLVEQPNLFTSSQETLAFTPKILPYPITFIHTYDSRDWPPVTMNANHYITQGLSDWEVPGSADQITAIDPAYQILAVGRETHCPSLVTTVYGKGRIVVHTANGDPRASHAVADQAYRRIIKWLAHYDRRGL